MVKKGERSKKEKGQKRKKVQLISSRAFSIATLLSSSLFSSSKEKGQKKRSVKKKEEGHSYLTQVKMTLFFIFLSRLRLCVLCAGVCSKYFFHFLFLNGLENPKHVPLYVWFLIMLS